jgi:hypothetical protein
VRSTLASRPCALHAPRNVRSFPDAGLQDFENDGSPFRSSAVLDVLRHQLAGPGRNLGPPCIPGSVCRKVRPLLDLAVCIPSEQSHRALLSHLKASELFETLPCESGAMICEGQVGRIDFARCVCFQRVGEQKAWIARACIPAFRSCQYQRPTRNQHAAGLNNRRTQQV